MMSEAEHILYEKILYAAFFFPLLLSGTLIWFLVFYLRRKHKTELERKDMLLRQQSLIIEKQQAVERERNRIAAEMHDDLGSGLTRIKFLSERALRQTQDQQESQQIKRIAEQSNKLVTNMSEIIWAMNSRFDTAENLAGYIRRYASEYLEEHDVKLLFDAETPAGGIAITAEKRRNVFLVVKEVLHNTMKHSGARGVGIRVSADPDRLSVLIREVGGRGFDPKLLEEKGNGLFNMQKRMEAVGGTLGFERTEDGMLTHLAVPLEKKPQ